MLPRCADFSTHSHLHKGASGIAFYRGTLKPYALSPTQAEWQSGGPPGQVCQARATSWSLRGFSHVLSQLPRFRQQDFEMHQM